MEPNSFFVQEPQIGCPQEKVEEAQNLKDKELQIEMLVQIYNNLRRTCLTEHSC